MNLNVLMTTLCASMLATHSIKAADCPAQATPPYPTTVVADYVLGCMLANGTSADVLRKCACSMDFIAESMPYEEYEKIETLLQLQQMPGGGRSAFYKSSNWAKNAVSQFREIQAESTLRCF